jgi:hypothetical protein
MTGEALLKISSPAPSASTKYRIAVNMNSAKSPQYGVRNSEFAGFQISVGRRFPNDEPGENHHRDKRNESEIDQQIVFDHVSLLGT